MTMGERPMVSASVAPGVGISGSKPIRIQLAA
jgi:hypothetical protein